MVTIQGADLLFLGENDSLARIFFLNIAIPLIQRIPGRKSVLIELCEGTHFEMKGLSKGHNT